MVRVEREPDLADTPDNFLQSIVGNSGYDKVLAARQPDVAAEARDQIGYLAHLLSAHHAKVYREADVAQAGAFLLVDSHVVALVSRQRQFGQVFERAAEASLDQFAELDRTVVIDHELEPRLDARDSIFGSQPPYVDNRA